MLWLHELQVMLSKYKFLGGYAEAYSTYPVAPSLHCYRISSDRSIQLLVEVDKICTSYSEPILLQSAVDSFSCSL